ncbi:hypothetical protein OV207_28765 [Corallococcus sp. BB11-1]|uniref:hypothetical protein n=1 Tax=Corallococcus sp. BB11-1 TaxID=2996783 RepID=UPI0022708DC9|nr:hypothetical protein [Corallococcus sp. BB11-1]MCY1035469.1 hypothetical protein [Corallococcus sp. BB11-1]
MKVEGQDAPSGHEKVPPEKEAFQQVLQQTSQRRGPRGPPGSLPPPGTVAVGRPPGSRPTLPPGTTGLTARIPSARALASVVSTARSALGSPETLRQARQGMHMETQRLGTVRHEAQVEGREQASHRASELIARELERSFRAEPRPAPPPVPPSHARADSPGEGAARTASTEARNLTAGPSGSAGASDTPVAQVESTLALIEKIEVFVKSQRPALGLSLRGALEATVEVERTGPREVALRIQGRHGPLPTEDVTRLRDALEARGLRLSVLRAE